MPRHYKLRENEHVIRTVRRHPAVLSIQIKLELLILLAALFFMFPLFRLGAAGIAAVALLIILSLFLMFRTWLMWHSNVFIITDRRIIDIERTGFFHWVVSEGSFANIQDISTTTSGIIQTVLGAGDVVVQTASGFVNLELRFVKDPAGVKDAINEARGIWDTDKV